MTSQLQISLQNQIHSGWQSNPATNQIINGYGHYHAVLAITGAFFLLISLWLTVRFWIKFKKIPKLRKFKWPFDKKVYFSFASVLTLVAIFLTLIVAANISTAAKPLPGISGSIPSLADTSYNRQLHKSFSDWILSGKSTPPTLVQQSIHHRRVFHTTRAIISGILLGVFSLLSIRLWKALVSHRKNSEGQWTFKDAAWLAAEIITVALALFMMIAFMANLQSAIEPIANTLQFG